MVFQHQYQYQYQYQTQLGFQYQSFDQLIHELPLTVIVLSIFIALSPFFIYLLHRRGVIPSVMKPIFKAGLLVKTKLRDRSIKSRITDEYTSLRDKRIEFGSVVSLGFYLANVVLFLLVATKMIFFGLVVSQSMLPTLAPADLVLCEAISINSIEKGDIVVFSPPNGGPMTIHRVVRVGPDGIRTRGDNVGTMDPWTLKKEDIVGKAVMVNGKPVILKNFGTYFMPRRTYIPGSDPAYDFVRGMINAVHRFGPIFIISLALLALVFSFGGKKKRYLTYS